MNTSSRSNLFTVHVGHSLPALDFAPFFVADALGYFKDEGLVVHTLFDPHREPPIQKFLAGELDCLLTGPLRTFDIEHRGVRPAVPSIVTINHKCPFYLVGTKPEHGLQLEGLQGKRVILYGGSPPPNLLLKHLVRMTNIAPESIHWVEGIVGNDQIRALSDGVGDYALLTQPEVELLLTEGRGHIVLSLVELLGPLHFSTVVASRRFLDEHPIHARGITRGVQRAKRWMARQPIASLVDLAAPLAPQLDRGVLGRIIRRATVEEYWVGAAAMPRFHYEWLKKAYSTESSFHKPVEFTDGVYNRFADELSQSEISEGNE
jgi:NitT/TauT family transport system substrate-binding protein